MTPLCLSADRDCLGLSKPDEVRGTRCLRRGSMCFGAGQGPASILETLNCILADLSCDPDFCALRAFGRIEQIALGKAVGGLPFAL